MNICFMCDLHLPFYKNALQYKVLDWAVTDIIKNKPDCIAFAGDATCDGEEKVYKYFVEKMKSIGIPFLFIPGNSDLRNPDSLEKIKKISSECKNKIGDCLVFAVNDSTGEISESDFLSLEEADEKSIVFLHHPITSLKNKSREKMLKWRENHHTAKLFYAHCHLSAVDGNDVSLGAMDPDKAIGENPCITYYDSENDSINKSYFSCLQPEDFIKHIGVSCYKVFEHINFAIENGLENIELRPNCIDVNSKDLLRLIEKWRQSGGKNLSVHLPDIVYENSQATVSEKFDKVLSLAKILKANRFTEHVPQISVKTVRKDESALEKITDLLAEKFNSFDYDITVGIENMHMTPAEKSDDSRRFGYIPEECIELFEKLKKKCKHKVGINFDIGHARNNAPYSSKYQTSTWLEMIGEYAVGYHIHQVVIQNGLFENHMPITDVYGSLISYASFFRYWEENRINKAPLILEMRPEGAYEKTLETFNFKKA